MADVAELVKASRRFYRDHDLADWARAVPKSARVATNAEREVRHADRSGFTLGFAFPPFALQMEQFDRLVEACACKPAAELPDGQQYSGDIFLADSWTRTATGTVLQRSDDLGGRELGPYLLLLAPAPVKNAWGRTGRQIEELFQAK